MRMNSISVQVLCILAGGFGGRSSVVFEVPVGEGELSLLSLAPPSFVVEIYIGSLLELLCDFLGLFVPLEPREVLLVVPP